MWRSLWREVRDRDRGPYQNWYWYFSKVLAIVASAVA